MGVPPLALFTCRFASVSRAGSGLCCAFVGCFIGVRGVNVMYFMPCLLQFTKWSIGYGPCLWCFLLIGGAGGVSNRPERPMKCKLG